MSGTISPFISQLAESANPAKFLAPRATLAVRQSRLVFQWTVSCPRSGRPEPSNDYTILRRVQAQQRAHLHKRWQNLMGAHERRKSVHHA